MKLYDIFGQSGFAALIFLLTFGIFKFFKQKSNPLKKIWFWMAWLVATPILYTGAVIFMLLIFSYAPSREFSKEEWLDKKEQRVELVDDLIDRKMLDGLTENEVLELLGEPEKNNYYFKSLEWDFIYYLGLERGLFRIDSEWLLIWIEDGVVDRYEIHRD